MRLCVRPSVPKRVIIRGPSCRTFSGQQFWQLRNIRRNPPHLIAPVNCCRLFAGRTALFHMLRKGEVGDNWRSAAKLLSKDEKD
jgi:hypothetical protein